MKARAAAALLVLTLACRKSATVEQAASRPVTPPPPEQEAPVALNGDVPIQYPPRLYEQRVEGDVVLRLFVDSAGQLAADSSRVAESSGYPALDSAALAGAQKLRFAPARRRGIPVGATFLQPIEFRHSRGRAARTAPPATDVGPGPAPVRRDSTKTDTTKATKADSTKPDTAHAAPR
ncbi:MAG TPA: energy transducer TonB [Gemmatimonadales bacterium]|nr:energy transducer TonB [Gemmatimonadales bacterium]